jgi:hypothetical protein
MEEGIWNSGFWILDFGFEEGSVGVSPASWFVVTDSSAAEEEEGGTTNEHESTRMGFPSMFDVGRSMFDVRSKAGRADPARSAVTNSSSEEEGTTNEDESTRMGSEDGRAGAVEPS